MIKRILVPLDGSGTAERALPLAWGIAARTGAEVLLLSAVVPGEHWAGPALVNPSDEDERCAAEDYLQSVARPTIVRRLNTRIFAIPGRAASVITGAAEAEECDLIIMTTQGRSGLSTWVVGSVADKVRQSGQTPLLLIHARRGIVPPVTEVHRILVPLDGSELAERALPLAQDLARAFHAGLVIQQIVVPPTAFFTDYLPPNAIEEVRGTARAYLDKIAGTVRDAGIEAEFRVDVGLPSQTILALADSGAVDMIAMTTHARSALGRFVMGSVAESVSRHADVPCLIVPARDNPAPEADKPQPIHSQAHA
jgi:nucleotide-binding universal stress UspA family protein